MVLPEVIGSKFLYFGYGSNLLKKRILMNNKSAVRKGFGKLEVGKYILLELLFTVFLLRTLHLVSMDSRKDGWALLPPSLQRKAPLFTELFMNWI